MISSFPVSMLHYPLKKPIMIDFQKELNDEQVRVVTGGDGACLVLAGAGSGKTRTITYRVAYLLEQGIAPEQILLVTFTNKAAKEMTTRVQQLVGSQKTLPWSGTFHHIAYRILRKYAPVIGYQNNFSILDSQDSTDMIKLCLKAEGIDTKEKRFPSAKIVQSIISYARNAQTTIADVVTLKYSKWAEYIDDFVRVTEEYTKRKRAANVMDFDDLLTNLLNLLTNSERVRQTFAEQFKYVLVDEYQDTNKVQAAIIDRFASVHKNILVVGDDAQSIYSFRAADIQNILDFEQNYPGAKVFRLETNYRSTPNILDVANDVIAANTDQYEKELKTHHEPFTKPELHAFVDKQEEAEFIAKRIMELEDEGVELGKIAILFRAAHHPQVLEVELTKRNIPYDFRGGIRFFDRAHIKDVLSFLRVVSNKTDAIAWSRILNLQVGIGPGTAAKIIDAIAQNPDASLENLADALPARAKIGWNDCASVLKAMDQTDGSPSALIQAVLDSKYAAQLEKEYENAADRIQDIEQLAIFSAAQDDLSRFLAEASMQESYATAGSKNVSDEDKVILSTIHQAKGLEWDAVFIISLASGQFPNERALRERNGVEEERRLFYVAITRARKYLYMSYPLTARFNSVLSGPSMFIDDISRDLLDEHTMGTVMGNTVFSDPSDDVDDIQYVPEDEPFSSGGGFLKSFDENLEVYSAGTKPAYKVSSHAIKTMNEIGIDISSNLPEDVDKYLEQSFDYVITVCGNAKETCPVFMGEVKHNLHIGFEDPADATGTEEEVMEVFRKVRDQIKDGFYKFYKENISI